MTRDEISARARALIGVRFRPQGRRPDQGLDCIGVAAMAMGVKDARADYPVRMTDRRRIEAEFNAYGFMRLPPDRALPADIVVVDAGHGHLHVVILTDAGFLHADARLRRVVEAPGPLPWPKLSVWRHPDCFAADDLAGTIH